MKRFRFLMPLGLLAILAVFGAAVMLLWNWLMPVIFGLADITFWQALGLLVLYRMLIENATAWLYRVAKNIIINPRHCYSCWQCMDACPKKVFGKIQCLWHHHVYAKHPDACIGCNKCVRACAHGAISRL